MPTEIFLRPLILSKSGIEEVYCRLRSWSRAVAPGGLGEAQGVIFMMKIKCMPPVSNRGLRVQDARKLLSY